LETSTVQSASSSSSVTKRTSLSTGIIVGLGVGIPAAVIAALVLGLYVYQRKVKSTGTTPPSDTQAHEPKIELSGTPVNELYINPQPSELPSRLPPSSGMYEMQ
jgi:H+/gluconate symporter-like permease